MKKLKSEVMDTKDLPIVFQEPIPTIYCDGFMGMTFSENVVKLNLTEERSSDKEMVRYVIGRLTMPTKVFFSFVDVLIKLKEEALKELANQQDSQNEQQKDK